MPATRSMAAADSTEVPPNFMTIMAVEQPFRVHEFGVEDGGAGGAADGVVAQGDELLVETGQGRRRPTKQAMPRSRSASLRGCGRSFSVM